MSASLSSELQRRLRWRDNDRQWRNYARSTRRQATRIIVCIGGPR